MGGSGPPGPPSAGVHATDNVLIGPAWPVRGRRFAAGAAVLNGS